MQKEQEQEEVRDEEGLLQRYDVILCGTGLVQSILASALARAGKSVLHCDGNDYYGEMDTVWNDLDYMMTEEQKNTSGIIDEDSNNEIISLSGGMSSFQWHSPPPSKRECIASFQTIQVGTKVQTSQFGIGTVTRVPSESNPSLEVVLDNWKLANDQSPTVYFRLQDGQNTPSNSMEQAFLEQHGIQSCKQIRVQEILNNRRSMALDVSPVFCLASGRAVQGMLSSNVADYLEFKTIDGLYWLNDDDNDDNSTMMRVPCSKNDVFQTKLLKPMDKRRLMKFIQLSMDYATQLESHDDDDGDQDNDNDNNNNNNDKPTEENTEDQVKSLNERHLNQGRSLARPQNKAVITQEFETLQNCLADDTWTFQTFLEKKQKLSSPLLDIVRYALAWETESTSISLRDGMNTLQQHLQALGRYGTTAFLVPMYGSGELSQAFCRSAAVFGATYLLRRAPIGITVTASEKQVGSVMVTAENQSNPKTIACSAVVVPSTCVPSSIFTSAPKRERILRRISILNGKLIPSVTEGEDRHVLFIPPKSKNIGNSHAIHCVTLDDSVQVSPSGCTIMHLTTTVDCDADSDVVDASILNKACQAILKAHKGEVVEEVYHVSYSHEVVLPDTCEAEAIPDGMFLCRHNGQVLTADVAFEQAQQIFSQICPGMQFLGLSEELDACIRERAAERGFADEEKYMLDTALDMIGKEEAEAKKEEGLTETIEAATMHKQD